MCMRACLLTLLGALALPAHGRTTFIVSPFGSDANLGTAAKPFATLERARDAVRAAKSSGPATVEVRGGLYEMQKPLVLTEQDSGTGQNPVIWRDRKSVV